MAQVHDVGSIPVSFLTSESLATAQYKFVESSGSAYSGYVALANSGSATYAPLGVLQNEPASGEEAAVVMFGPTKVKATAPGTRILNGHLLTCDGNGQAVYTSVASRAVGFALETADSSGSCYIEMFFTGMSHFTRKV